MIFFNSSWQMSTSTSIVTWQSRNVMWCNNLTSLLTCSLSTKFSSWMLFRKSWTFKLELPDTLWALHVTKLLSFSNIYPITANLIEMYLVSMEQPCPLPPILIIERRDAAAEISPDVAILYSHWWCLLFVVGGASIAANGNTITSSD